MYSKYRGNASSRSMRCNPKTVITGFLVALVMLTLAPLLMLDIGKPGNSESPAKDENQKDDQDVVQNKWERRKRDLSERKGELEKPDEEARPVEVRETRRVRAPIVTDDNEGETPADRTKGRNQARYSETMPRVSKSSTESDRDIDDPPRQNTRQFDRKKNIYDDAEEEAGLSSAKYSKSIPKASLTKKESIKDKIQERVKRYGESSRVDDETSEDEDEKKEEAEEEVEERINEEELLKERLIKRREEKKITRSTWRQDEEEREEGRSSKGETGSSFNARNKRILDYLKLEDKSSTSSSPLRPIVSHEKEEDEFPRGEEEEKQDTLEEPEDTNPPREDREVNGASPADSQQQPQQPDTTEDTTTTQETNSIKQGRDKLRNDPSWADGGHSRTRTTTNDIELRREAVKNAFLHAWQSYERYAWGHDELQPQTKDGKNWFSQSGMGVSILDAMDTMYIMGLKEEFMKARDWIAANLQFDKVGAVSTFETTIRSLGGLLSCYGLTGDPMFVDKAVDLGHRLLKAFAPDSPIPKASVNLQTGESKNPGWTGGKSILAEAGTLQMEFLYLARITEDPAFARQVANVIDLLDEQPKPDGLYPIYIEPNGKLVMSSLVTLGALGDSFYEYLLKTWLLTAQQIPKYKRMYAEAARGIADHMIAKSAPNKLTYLAELSSPAHKTKVHKMDHLACFAGGMFALGAATGVFADDPERETSMWTLGKEVTATCHESYARSPTKIGPEIMDFNPVRAHGNDFQSQASSFLLRPETVESYFVLWRLTHDPIYREWGWEAFEAIEQHCRMAVGYAGLHDVNNPNSNDNVMQSWFLAETLKYLYLLFCDDDVIPLDRYVFNTEAHPLPVFPAKDFGSWKDFVGSNRYD